MYACECCISSELDLATLYLFPTIIAIIFNTLYLLFLSPYKHPYIQYPSIDIKTFSIAAQFSCLFYVFPHKKHSKTSSSKPECTRETNNNIATMSIDLQYHKKRTSN